MLIGIPSRKRNRTTTYWWRPCRWLSSRWAREVGRASWEEHRLTVPEPQVYYNKTVESQTAQQMAELRKVHRWAVRGTADRRGPQYFTPGYTEGVFSCPEATHTTGHTSALWV